MPRLDPFSGRFNASIFPVLFFFSGISGLIYQLVWMRMLIRVFGISLYAISTIVAVFMGGLAIGSWLAGKFLRGKKASLRVYAYLEAAIGLSAIVASFGMKYLPAAYIFFGSRWYGIASTEATIALIAIRFFFSAAIIAIPTILMGATLPVLGQCLAQTEDSLGKKLASLYGMNTLGAVLGDLVTGFIALAVIGESGSVALGAAINFIVASTAFGLHHRKIETSESPSHLVLNSTGDTRNRFLYAAAIASGFCAISMELLWTRLLIFLVGSSVYAFSIVLSVFLLGIACGSLVSTRFVDRLKSPGQFLGIVQILISFAGLLSLYVFWELGIHNSDARFLYSPLQDAGSIFQFLFFSALILFVSTFLMGISFPVLGKAVISESAKFASSVGNLYAWNTLGGVVGSLATGYCLVPAIGTQASICLVSFLGLLAGVIIVVRYSGADRKMWIAFSGVALLFLFAIPSKTNIVVDVLKRRLERHYSNYQILFHREEAAGMLTGVQIPQGVLLLINGIITSGNGIPGHIMAHLPLLLHPAPKQAAIICFGVGNTFRAAVDHISNVDAVELMPGVVKSFADFFPGSSKYLSATGVQVFVEDGRQHLLMINRRYDVVIVDASPPIFSAGTVNLYSKDFLEICRSKLSSDGIFCLWVPTPCFERDYWQIAKGFSVVFPHVFTWRKKGMAGVLLMGSSADLMESFGAISKRLKERSLGESAGWLTADFITDADYFFDADIRARAAPYDVITDNRPLTEFPLWNFLLGRKYWISNEFLSNQ